MKAVVYQEPHKVTVEQMPDPKIEAPTDAIIRITTSNICGSDLHMYDGRTPAEPGFIFGHENMGIVEEVGPERSATRLDAEASRDRVGTPGQGVFPRSIRASNEALPGRKVALVRRLRALATVGRAPGDDAHDPG